MSDLFNLFDEEDLSKSLSKKIDTTKKKKIKAEPLNEKTLCHCNKSILIGTGEYKDFDLEKYPRSLNFYDFEVFLHDWCVVIINPIDNRKTIIWNDRKALINYYEEHKKEIWVGYNSRNYDVNILKGIYLGMNPKKINDAIILEGKKGFEISDEFRKIKLYNFDIAILLKALKQLEGFMGNDIRETTVPFDLPRQLNESEMKETIYYCEHDVEQTIEVFRRRLDEYSAYMSLINTFELPFKDISMTKSQIVADILECEKTKHDDEFDIHFVPAIHLKKYKYVQDWFIESAKKKNYKAKLETNIANVPHQFGWGGVHGAPEEPVNCKGIIFHADVTSFYPSIMIEWDKLTRNCKHPEKYKIIYDTRVALKKAGKKKEQAPFKICLNGTFGICKDKNSKAYDPLRANEICINGQLLLLDLIEHIENYCELIQSNTDGIIVRVEDDEEKLAKFNDACDRWCKRTRMGLGRDRINWISQANVNNYIFQFENGSYERKGGMIKENNDLDNDLPIINESLFQYIVNGILPYETINKCDDFKMFQKIVRISGNYLYGVHDGERLTDKTFRVYASSNYKDGTIYKVKEEGGTLEKFADTPDNCFIYNENVNGISIKDSDDKRVKSLNKQWYVDLANKRLKTFGFDVNEMSLF